MEKFSDSYADIKWVEGKSTKGKARNSAAPAATLGVETTSAVDEIDDFGLVPFENGEQIDGIFKLFLCVIIKSSVSTCHKFVL